MRNDHRLGGRKPRTGMRTERHAGLLPAVSRCIMLAHIAPRYTVPLADQSALASLPIALAPERTSQGHQLFQT